MSQRLPPDACVTLDPSLARYVGDPVWVGIAWEPLDEGHEYWRDRRATVDELREAATERSAARYADALPSRYRAYTREALRVHAGNRQAVEEADRLEAGRNLYAWGGAGNGKTHLAVATGWRFARAGYTVSFWGVVNLFARLRASFGTGEPRPDLETPQVLILDDLGKLKPTEFAFETIYGALEHRWANELTTVFTANHRPSVAAAQLSADGESAAAILSRMASGVVVEVRGRDERLAS